MTSCKSFQERLAENGPELAETDSELRTHLTGCTDCSAFLADLRQIETDLRGLDGIDAPDALVGKTLRAVQDAVANDTATQPYIPRRRWFAGGIAASIAVAASLVLMLNTPAIHNLLFPIDASIPLDQSSGRPPTFNLFAPPAGSNAEFAEQSAKPDKSKESFEITELDESLMLTPDGTRDLLDLGKTDGDGFSDFAEQELEAPSGRDDFSRSTGSLDELLANRQLLKNFPLEVERLLPPPEIGAQAKVKLEGRYRQEPGQETEPREYAARKSANQSVTPTDESEVSDFRLRAANEDLIDPGSPADDAGVAEMHVPGNKPPSAVASRELNARLEIEDKKRAGAGDAVGSTSSTVVADEPAAEAPAPLGGLVVPPLHARVGGHIRDDPEAAQATVPDLLARYAAADNLVYQDPIGYWANTYIPGDPAMRLLAARLDDWDRTALGRDLRLEQAVNPVEQPFDAPRDAAMAVYLNADTPFIDGPTRMRVQVGLKGSERQGGRRPAMNIGLVVDLREPADAETATRIRALIEALERARQPEDQFSLIFAGAHGGLLVEPDQFRHGPIRVAMDRVFGDALETPAEAVSLQLALGLAADMVLTGDDPTAVLGSSLVLLATGSSLAGDVDQIAQFAHRNAVAGVPLSVISFGAANSLDHIDRLVAAGQGNRRILASGQAAEAVIDRELHAASRAVARALRLRIRLAPGVQLIDVLGSQRLDEPMARRVREAEQSIDQRLARNLGITADRGDDEDGIQIVIPNFYAGDSHVILLDVVAERPGPIADVRVRYKDVAHLRNGVTEASLAVDDQPKQAGPLERNVLKNLVAWELSRQTREAGRALASGDLGQAQVLIATLRDEIRDLRAQVAGWPADPGLGTDQSVLDDYVAALASPATANFEQRRYLSDSLTYAAFRKLQPIRQ